MPAAVCSYKKEFGSGDRQITEETKPGKANALESPGNGDKEKLPRSSWWWGLVLLVIILPVLLFVRMPETPLDKAIALVKSNKAAAALPILEDIAAKHPENIDVQPWLALCYLNTERIAEGRTALDTAVKMKLPAATLEPAIRSFIGYYCQRNDFSEAERLFEHMRTMRAGQQFSKELNEERRKMYVSWSDFHANRSELEPAVQHLETAVSIPDIAETDKAQLIHKLADHYRQMAATADTVEQNEHKAIAILEKSLVRADEPSTRIALADLYARVGFEKKAIEHLHQVSGMDSNNLESRRKLVELCIKLSDVKGARDALVDLLEREKSVENYQLLASLNLKLENYAGAVRALEDASSLSRNDLTVLQNLRNALLDWSTSLAKTGKQEESLSVKGRADRITEMIKGLEEGSIAETAAEPAPGTDKPLDLAPGAPPISLSTSRIWLSKGSFTPEGEITVKNISPAEVSDLSLSAVFFDNTTKKRTGSVTVSAASPSHPMLAGQQRTLYFSSPNIVKSDHILCVLIFWKGKLIRELPVVKER